MKLTRLTVVLLMTFVLLNTSTCGRRRSGPPRDTLARLLAEIEQRG